MDHQTTAQPPGNYRKFIEAIAAVAFFLSCKPGKALRRESILGELPGFDRVRVTDLLKSCEEDRDGLKTYFCLQSRE